MVAKTYCVPMESMQLHAAWVSCSVAASCNEHTTANRVCVGVYVIASHTSMELMVSRIEC